MTEHASFTFAVEGVSRALLAQLTRHRIASFSVQSQRYVSMADGFDYVIPRPSRRWARTSGRNSSARWRPCTHGIATGRKSWVRAKGGANEDARFVLPNAAATRLVMTMNARGADALFLAALLQPRAMGDSRNGVADARPVQAGPPLNTRDPRAYQRMPGGQKHLPRNRRSARKAGNFIKI